MYAYLKGTVADKGQNELVLDVQDVGYLLFVSMTTLQETPPVGKTMKLFTYLSVREDAMELFGFADREELSCFKLLTTVSGVGPKVGLAILSELTPERVALSVAAGDHKALTKAAGVGPKLAQRITLELRDKFAVPTGAVDMPSAGGQPSAAGNAAEAVRALTVLGFTAGEAAAAVGKLDGSEPVESLVRQALKALANR